MGNAAGTIWVTYNGELYNHLDLRRDLEARGHHFRTRSDTEVLVHGWAEWGEDLLPRMNGIFAFAIMDARGGPEAAEIWLARDPVGVKPLYVGLTALGWWFASEIRAAREAGLLNAGLRSEAFDEFLVYRFVPSPGTIYRDAWKLPPGHLCRLPLNVGTAGPAFRPFTPRFAPAVLPAREGEWKEAVRSQLQAAVRRQLMSDVPVGSLLSGGVDSTVVTRIMRDNLSEPPQAFAIGFEQDQDGGELAVARRAALALGVPLQEITAREHEYRRDWPLEAGRMGEPVANSGAMLVEMLCRTVSQTHKVVLSGQGADEPLGGYSRHTGERWYPISRHFQGVLARLPEGIAQSDRVSRMRRVAAESDEARRFTQILSVFAPREAVELTGHRIDPDALVDPVRRWLPDSNGRDTLNRLLFVDARLSLADDLLIVADHMAMAHSVELRVPFLDLEFLALLERMPSRYKVSMLGERKWLYREAVTPLVPKQLRRALVGWQGRVGRKLGFTTPLDQWFGSWIDAAGAEYLVGPDARLPGFVSPSALQSELELARRPDRRRVRQIMTLFVLESWLRGAM